MAHTDTLDNIVELHPRAERSSLAGERGAPPYCFVKTDVLCELMRTVNVLAEEDGYRMVNVIIDGEYWVAFLERSA